MAGYVSQNEIKPIQTKEYIIKNWEKYNLVNTKEEFIQLLNILQACDETIDSLHDVVLNGETEFCDCINYNGWKSDRDVVDMLFYFCSFYTEKEFIDLIIERHQDYIKEEEDDYPEFNATERKRKESSDRPEEFSDTQITKTDDGYVIRIWC